MNTGLKLIICGHVQGVSYRWWAKKTAIKLRLKGYAKNLPNGNVEIVVVGDEDKLEIFVGKCWEGPELADVQNIFKENIETKTFKHFDIRF